MTAVRIIGTGRAGEAFRAALESRGWQVLPSLRRGEDPAGAAAGVDLVLIATRDAEVPAVAAAVAPVPGTTVAHLSGLLGLEALIPHEHRAAIHPLVSLPAGPIGAERLTGGAWFGVTTSGSRAEAAAASLVEALGGRMFAAPGRDRALYHAAASIAANHLVALMGQAERVGAAAGMPAEALRDLARTTLENVNRIGPVEALTGPVARGDWATVAAHRRALDPSELPAYDAMAAEAARLAGTSLPQEPTAGNAAGKDPAC